jgi:hypothetical protein
LLEHPYEELDRLQEIDEALTKTLNLIDPKHDFRYPIKLQAKPIDAKTIRTELAENRPGRLAEHRPGG